MGKKAKLKAFDLRSERIGRIRASGPSLVEVDVVGGGLTKVTRDGLTAVILDDGLRSASQAFEGKEVYAFKAADRDFFDHFGPAERKWLSENHVIGWLRDGRVVDNAARYDLKLKPGVPAQILDLIRAAAASPDDPPIGLSVDCGTRSRRVMHDGRLRMELFEFGNHESGPASVDIVTNPAARGAFRRIAASVAQAAQQERDTMTDAETKAAAEKAKADEGLLAEREAIKLAAEDAKKAAEGVKAELAALKIERSLLSAQTRVEGSKLPSAAREKIMAALKAKGTVVTTEDADKEIAEMRALLASATESLDIKVGATSGDKMKLGLERLVLGPAPARWVEEKFAALSGYSKLTMAEREQEAGIGRRDRANSFRQFFHECHGGDIADLWNRRRDDPRRARLLASITTSTWADNFENALNIVGQAYAEDPDYQDWRQIVTIVPLTNIHAQERPITGGYANLPTVAEGVNYTAATSPGDEGHSYTVAKYGYTEDWTREAMLQDRVGELQAIPRKMGLAYARTVYETIFDKLTFAGHPTMDYDSVVLFNNTSHSNVTTTALGAAALEASRLKMKQQTDISNSKRLGIRPAFLLVPEEKDKTAFDLLKPLANYPGGSTTDNEWVRRWGLTQITVRHWTNTTDWFLVASPNNGQVPTYEWGFEGGRQEPDISIQDMSNVGSVFDADKVTIKIATPFMGGSPLRHEGFQGNNV